MAQITLGAPGDPKSLRSLPDASQMPLGWHSDASHMTNNRSLVTNDGFLVTNERLLVTNTVDFAKLLLILGKNITHFGSERGRHGSPRAHTQGKRSHGYQEGFGMPPGLLGCHFSAKIDQK